MRKFIFFVLALTSPFIVSAQYRTPKYKKANNYKYYKKKVRPEYVVGIGAANFLGELGGANQIGTNFVKDLEFSMTRPSLQVGVRYKRNRWSVKTGVYYNLVSGSDALTSEPFRNNRNLSFRSNIFELSAQGEFFFTKQQSGHQYRIKNAKGMKNYDFQGYLFLGVGAFYFEPQAKYHGNWVNLQPLGTEGQGMPGEKKKYSRISVCIPYGIGVKYSINREYAIGLEVGMRKTFTDYIDDVSGVYYDNSALYAARGEVAAALADPSLHNYPESLGGDATGYKQTAAGQQRGDKSDKDAYMFINITVAYKVPLTKRTRSKF